MSEATDRLVKQAAQAHRERRFADAQQDLQSAITLLREGGSDLALAQALRSLGEVERKLRNRPAALQHYQEAITLLRRSAPPLMLAHTVRHLGDVYRENGQPVPAEHCYVEALNLYRSHPEADSLDLANAIRSFAVLKSETQATQDAAPLWQEARALYAQRNITAGVEECSRHLSPHPR